MNEELESTIIAGSLVKFVYLDPEGDRSKDTEFMSRCHFLPAVGDRVQLGVSKQEVFVKRIYHAFLQNDDFEKGNFCQIVTVVLTSHDALQDHESQAQ